MSLSKVTLINDNKFGYLSVASFGDIVLHILTDIPEQSFFFPRRAGNIPRGGMLDAPDCFAAGYIHVYPPPVGEIDG